jgi:hypothetical protein
MNCPNCKAKYVKCPECGNIYKHGEYSHCININCINDNIPLDCIECGLSVASNLKGVLSLDMRLIPYDERIK